MLTEDFTDTNGDSIIVYARKHAVIFEEKKLQNRVSHDFQFTKDTWKNFVHCINKFSREAWEDIEPKEAYSVASDYDSYWDSELDNEGCLMISNDESKGYILKFDKPSSENVRLYKFNRPKMQSFIYDLN